MINSYIAFFRKQKQLTFWVRDLVTTSEFPTATWVFTPAITVLSLGNDTSDH